MIVILIMRIGVYIDLDKIKAIALNKSKIDSSLKEKCVLCEELGHYYYSATYSPYCQDLQIISKQERKAKKWAYNVLIPFENLRKTILSGKTDIISLAEYYDVTCEFMAKCISFYLDKYGYILTEEEMLQVSI